ncbi:hypothetical protein FYJ43_07385 [Cutibacterium sp. WCA-380-WT-3A]|uniref:DUF3040 domain-containing protein n=1 Tax=Cutibacterium porci TaxID=2605781 RepID=A0A7K0J7C3_9ACTN|nr:hypothetical protein [Cutibacterium porci]MSS45861.1 hypothetical protein [Cutibacterium porci]
MEHDGNDVDAAFEALIAREFGEVVTAPGRPRPHDQPVRRAPAHIPDESPSNVDEVDEPLSAEPTTPPSPATRVGLVLMTICIVTVLLSMGGINVPQTALILAITSGGAGLSLLIWRAATRRDRDDEGPWGNHSRL